MKNLVLAFFLLLGVSSFSQTTVTGKVVDENGAPIPGTNIVVIGKAEGAVTDFDGNFTLTSTLTPPFQVRVTSIGFSESIVDVTANNQTLNISLSEASTLLDEIVISASRTPERIFESPVSVERFGIKEIKNTTAPSFYGGLQNLKGVDINTNSLTFNSVNTRGFATFANNRFLQLVDGIDNQSPGLNFALGNLVGINELDVSSVEILPGASSALYGAGAFNGILFLTGKNPFDSQGISFYAKTGLTSQVAAGDNGYYDIGIRAAHAFSDKFAAKVNFSFLQGEDWHANSVVDLANPGATRTDPNFDGLNIYGDEVSTLLNFDAAAGLPTGTVGSANVSRTGYLEEDLVNYQAQSVKTDFSLHYRPWANDFEIVAQGRIGRGNTIFQGTNRNAIRGFTNQQFKLEVRNDDFFIRAYNTKEAGGNSYDVRFTGININRLWKSDTQWFTEYAGTYIPAFLGGVQGGLSREAAETQAHAAARAVADTGRLVPGTTEFQQAFQAVSSNPDLGTGSLLINESAFSHINGNYNLAHLINDWADVQVGGSWREYRLNSEGTIFTDFDGPINYTEFGAYAQLQKKLLDERLKITASGRFDKNEFLDGLFSPRLAAGLTLGERRNHNIRASVQQAFRNPTTQDFFIGLDLGLAVLVGSSPDNLDRDLRTFNLSIPGQNLLGGQTTAQVVGRQAYENAFSLSSALAGTPTGVTTPVIQPEEVTAFELGYRAQLGKLTVDLSGYFNQFTNFIVNGRVLVPFYGNAAGIVDGVPTTPEQGLALQALQNGDTQVYQTYTNSEAPIDSWGAVVGLDYKLGKFDLGVNYTYNDLDFNDTAFPDVRTNFNTPNHRVKASFGSTEAFKNFGFNLNWRWSDTYFWQAGFADGQVPSFHVVDAQISYAIPSIKSVFKAGASNLLNEEYVNAIGTGNIGSIYFVSWTINN